MFIGIDGNEANVTNRVGSNVYAARILKGLAQLDKRTRYQVYLKSNRLPDLPKSTANWHYRTLKPAKLWTQWRLPLDLYTHRPRPQLFFTPGHYAPRFCPVKTIITILDLAFLKYPESFTPRTLKQLKSWTDYSVKKASHILTISQSSKADLISTYNLEPAMITVTYPGPNLKIKSRSSISNPQKIIKKYQLPDNFFIFTGTIQPRKNLPRLISAIEQLNQSRHQPIYLVITGKIWHQFAKENIPPSPYIYTTGFLPQDELISLMYLAKALVMPSLYEGFGLPVLEAMNLGVPVLASKVSSIPEITGPWRFLFDPTDTKAITQTLKDFLSLNPTQRQSLIKKGKMRAKLFTWDKCVRQTMEVLHELTFS